MTTEIWKEIGKKTIFTKYGRGICCVEFKMPNGNTEDFILKEEGDTASVLAVTPDNKVVLIETFRPGPKKIILELPGGYVDANEKPIDAAKREFMEETNYCGQFLHLLSYHDCAYSNRIRHCFLATECKLCSKKKESTILMDLGDFENFVLISPMTDVACALAGLQQLKKVPE